jgi:catechol 2,3-dioxygenase-like lactoylglutathione lyase family enzyme
MRRAELYLEGSAMKVGHIELFVGGPLKAKEFYVEVLGFRLVEVRAGMSLSLFFLRWW